VDPAKPSPARLYDYCLGGHNNFEADRKAAEALRQSLPALSDAALGEPRVPSAGGQRGWPPRPACGSSSDIGPGLPAVGNTHQVVQRIDPAARVVYAEQSTRWSRAQSSALLAGVPNVALITADLRDPDALLGHPAVRSMIDFAEPTGLLMTAVLHFVADDKDPWGLLARYVAALAPGSYPRALARYLGRAPAAAAHAMVETYANATEQFDPALAGRGGTVLRGHGDGGALPRGHRWPHVRRAVGSGGSGVGRQRRVAGAVLRGGEVPVTRQGRAGCPGRSDREVP